MIPTETSRNLCSAMVHVGAEGGTRTIIARVTLASTVPIRGTLPGSSGFPGRSGCFPLQLSDLGWRFALPR
jgi:hypothetical protein